MSGHDSARVPVPLHDALADLATLHSSDPAARHAMNAIKLTRLTLERFGAAEESSTPPVPR